MTPATWVWSITALLFGLTIGSFLNVVIWRLPRNGSLIRPEHSYCPHCERRLTAIDLVPLFSFLLLGRRCRACKQPISWRYFCVELLTGLLFFALAVRFHDNVADAASLMLFTALLVPMTFIDLEFFAIPEQLNLLAFAVAIGRDVWGIARHEPDHAPLFGWLPRSIVGAAVGIAIFGAVRVAGWIWMRKEAMGLGDVLLARAMGAMLVQLVPVSLPMLRLFPTWVLFSCISGMIVGIPLVMMRRAPEAAPEEERPPSKPDKRGKTAAKIEIGEPPPEEPQETLASQLWAIVYVVVLFDLVEYVVTRLPEPLGERIWERLPRGLRGDDVASEPSSIAEEEYTPDPHGIPFGPFLAVGFLATLFAGEALTAWYIAVAFPRHM